METPAATAYLAKLPFEFIHWWFLEAPVRLLGLLLWVFKAFVHLFSLKELFTTFFQPWKNEYREGLVRTAIAVGVVFKSMLIAFDIFILSFILLIEALFMTAWLALPFITIYLIYAGIFA